MRLKTVKKLCCPFDESELTLRIITKDDRDRILEGILSCTSCLRVYPIISGIPIMAPDEYRNFQLEQPLLEKWEKLIDTEPDKQSQLSEGQRD